MFPLDARVWPPSGQAYLDGACDLRSIHLRGEGAFAGLRVNLLYIAPGVVDDSHSKQGDLLGTLQDVAAWHQSRQPGKVMQNHTHMEVYELVNGVWVLRDPAEYLSAPLTCGD